MRIAEINAAHIGSTGRIMFGIAEQISLKGQQVRSFSPRFYLGRGRMTFPQITNHSYFGYRIENMMHKRLSQLTGFHGCFSFFGTIQLLRMLDQFRPDAIHLHNLHNWTINLPMLFLYIKKRNIRVVWTLHDCWSFTGQCPHFVSVNCEKWKSGCYRCPQYREYPQCYVDNTRMMYCLKKRWFTGVENMTLVTPSYWLASLVKESYMAEYPVQVIYNGIDLSVFKPTESGFRRKYKLENKRIVLGVAFGWGYKKGLDVLIRLAKELPDEYWVVLVGTDDEVDKQLPEGVISIHRTQDQSELAEIYTAADVFVNPTREDTFPTVNIEALACGTPVITFRTGGSPEVITEETGSVVECDDVETMKKEIVRVCTEKPYTQENCVQRAQEFDAYKRYGEYAALYEDE